jgi:AP-1 complex subunit gamma-1
MHMLGYQTSFINVTCINLLASSKFSDKRVAYIALCVLMDETSDILLLASHTIKKDLENTNQYIVAMALNAIGEICTSDMCRDTSAEVLKLFKHTNPYIKKKAALACTKIIRKCPELLENIADKLNLLLEDKHHGVLLAGLSLTSLIFKMEPSYIEKYKKYLTPLIKYLKNLSSTNSSPEYDIHGVTDPFLQVKILEVLAYFGKDNPDASEEMNDILASVYNFLNIYFLIFY